MNRRRLGRSGITVSDICLGTMTFGLQADERESFAIMDRAFEAGVNFFDTAEVYPVPPSAELVGVTEEIVGRWLKAKPREALIIATKITGPGHGWFVPPVRHGMTALDRHQIVRAVEGSLTRLGTDYIDLYQTHWPDHGMAYEETLSALTELHAAGKIRVAGCSNETCWGVMKSLAASEREGLVRYETVQNNFSMLNRRCESELAQVCRQEGVSLLPYSPLAGGVLCGKYQKGALPEGARFSDYIANGGPRQKMMAERFVNPRTLEATARFEKIAAGLGMSVTTLATAWSKQHDFVASTIIGASSVGQLDETLAAAEVVLDAETLKRIDQVEREIPHSYGEDGLRFR
jgi:aryl-alcohol dehydrogenase-like predicted oxidoreductase